MPIQQLFAKIWDFSEILTKIHTVHLLYKSYDMTEPILMYDSRDKFQYLQTIHQYIHIYNWALSSSDQHDLL